MYIVVGHAAATLPVAVVASVSTVLGVILVVLLVGALLGHIMIVKKILSQAATDRKQNTDKEELFTDQAKHAITLL